LAYQNLRVLKQNYPDVPILGLTATATINSRIDIAETLGLDQDYLLFKGSFNRPNLGLNILEKPFKQSKYIEELMKLLQKYEG
jgi:superfamily II DNA helicase RecQ